MIIFEIDKLPKLPNRLLGSHWRVRSSHAREWATSVWAVTCKQRPREPWKKVRLVLERHSSMRPDHDGLCGSFKHVIDALVKCGIIEDDTPAHILSAEYSWIKASPKHGKIRVQVIHITGETS